jgi:hypothetical protein
MNRLVVLLAVAVGCGQPGQSDLRTISTDANPASDPDAGIRPARPDANPCVVEDFDGDVLSDDWELLVGAMPTHIVKDSDLVITDAPFADTPSTPGTSWINDVELDRGNQIGLTFPSGTQNDFTIRATVSWASSLPEMSLAGIALTDADNKLLVRGEVRDDSLTAGPFIGSAIGSRRSLSRVEGSGEATWVFARVNGIVTIQVDGNLRVEADTGDFDVQHVVLFYVRYSDDQGAKDFGRFAWHDIEVCSAWVP